MKDFVNRRSELERLESLYKSNEPKLAVVYGRRRIGKTSLIIESIKGHENAVYHQAIQGTAEQQMDYFIDDISEKYPDVTEIRKEWDKILKYLVKKDAIVVIDEFPYLVNENKELPSVIQRIWDHEVDNSSTTFVLTGSSIGMMQDVAVDGKAPLYGRISKQPSGKLDIGPLPFKDAMKFFPEYTPEEQVMAFGIFGGTPEYLRAVDPSRTLKENVTNTLLHRDGGLHEEPEDVLHRELKEVDRYFAVLKAMAEGNRKNNEIGQASGVKSGSEGYYLDRLRKLRIIERSYPTTVDPGRSRQGRYKIRDPLFRFWFRFIYGRPMRYEVYGDDAYKDLIEPELPDFVSSTFEELCQRTILQIYDHNFIEKPGNWWDGDGHEIDIVAPTSEEKLVVGEVKFRKKPLDYGVLAQLEREAPLVHWKPPKGNRTEYEYVFFSRGGFSSSVKEAAEEREDVRLFTLDDVVSLLSQKDARSGSTH